MKPDGTDSLSAASESKSTPLGIHLPGSDKQADSVVKLYHQPKESPWPTSSFTTPKHVVMRHN